MLLTAFVVSAGATIEPASRWRDWMNATDQRFANRCLPLLMANQAGWTIALDHAVTARWSGGPRPEDVTVRTESALAPVGHFGHGILTWHVAFLFRTEAGWNLLARGPANLAKDGIAALEGLVETDWAPATFTMNWRFTRACEVRWEAGEPFAMVLPQRRGELETVTPVLTTLDESPDVEHDHLEWQRSRADFLTALQAGGTRRSWQGDYFRGRTVAGDPTEAHATTMRLAPFGEPVSSAGLDRSAERLGDSSEPG